MLAAAPAPRDDATTPVPLPCPQQGSFQLLGSTAETFAFGSGAPSPDPLSIPQLGCAEYKVSQHCYEK